MNLLENFKNIIERAKELDAKSLEAMRYFLMGFLMLDLFGVYWYFELKKLGMALLIVVVFLMLIVIILEGNLSRKSRKEVDEMGEQEQELEPKKSNGEGKVEEPEDKKKDEEETEEPNILGEGMGLPNAEEYNERMEKAIF